MRAGWLRVGSESRLDHLTILQAWADYVTSLSLSVLICEMGNTYTYFKESFGLLWRLDEIMHVKTRHGAFQGSVTIGVFYR